MGIMLIERRIINQRFELLPLAKPIKKMTLQARVKFGFRFIQWGVR